MKKGIIILRSWGLAFKMLYHVTMMNVWFAIGHIRIEYISDHANDCGIMHMLKCAKLIKSVGVNDLDNLINDLELFFMLRDGL